MCFSAEASFGSGVVLSIAGSIALRRAKKPEQLLFAGIPKLFSLQQFTEGFVWTAFRSNDVASWLTPASYVFLTFVLLIWPVWVPLSAWLMEKNTERKKLLFISLCAGILFSVILLYCLIIYPVNVTSNHYHIHYEVDTPYNHPVFSRVLYLTATVFSLLISGINKVRWLGVIILSSYAFSLLFFYEYSLSVWCFFAAIASILIIYIITDLKEYGPKSGSYLDCNLFMLL